jgi:phosphate transport system substrate-binding protein
MRSLFHAEARLVPMVKGQGGMRPQSLTVDDYVRRSGPMLERDGFFEQEIHNRTDVFGDFAHALSTYEGRLRKDDAEPFLRGINSIQMVRQGGRWWVLHVLWEQEHDAGPIPAQYLPERSPTKKAAAAPPLTMKGSDLLLDVAQDWAEAYHAHAEVGISVMGGGTSIGFQALATGEAQLAMASRRMSEAEIAAVRASGAEAMELQVGWQALAVCVAAENPLRSLTLEQLAAIYRDADSITKWSQLGVKWPEADDTIVPVCRQSNSGTHEFFRTQVLGQASLRLGIAEFNGSKDIVHFVATHAGAIGFCPPAYLGDAGRAVALAGKQGNPAVPPTDPSVRDGSYPLARPFYLYFRDEPSGRVKAFAQWILGPDGRALTQQAGYVTKPQ